MGDGTDVDEAYERHVRGRTNDGDGSPDGSDDDEHTQPPPDPPLPWCRAPPPPSFHGPLLLAT